MQPLDYLSPLAHFQKRTDGVEGSCAADVQVGLVEGLEDPDEVRTLLLEKKGDVADQNPKCHEVKYTPWKEIEIHDVTVIAVSVYVEMQPVLYIYGITKHVKLRDYKH